jgi:hypothetical protein
VVGRSRSVTADDPTLKLFRANADQWNRQRATRATLVDLSEEARQELQDIWDALVEGKGIHERGRAEFCGSKLEV